MTNAEWVVEWKLWWEDQHALDKRHQEEQMLLNDRFQQLMAHKPEAQCPEKK